MVKNKNRKKQVGTGLTVNEAVDTKVKDFPLARDEKMRWSDGWNRYYHPLYSEGSALAQA